MIKAVLFDFGGVLAEEGFREGLKTIGAKNGLDPESFFALADSLIYESGYLTGRADEPAYWNALRSQTGIAGSDEMLRNEILARFVLRHAMIEIVDRLRARGLIVALLSDQTNWLEELDRKACFSAHFDHVFNSFRIHKSKRDPSIFREICADLNIDAAHALFIDDNIDHIRRAAAAGLQTILFTEYDNFKKQLGTFIEPARDGLP